MGADTDPPAIVLDTAGGTCRAGVAGEPAPRVVFPAVIGHPKFKPLTGIDGRPYIGQTATRHRGILTLHRPIKEGLITDWDHMEALWSHAFHHELGLSPESHPVLMSLGPFMSRESREQLAEVMFEKFQVPAVALVTEPVLLTEALGRTTAVVVYVGYDLSYVVPVYEGYALLHAADRLDVTGEDVRDFLSRSLVPERGVWFGSQCSANLKYIESSLCYVATECQQQTMGPFTTLSTIGHEYLLPDGSKVRVGDELFTCPEALFKPSLIGKQVTGIHESVYNAVTKCDRDIHHDLYSNMLLFGESCIYPGLVPRMSKEVAAVSCHPTVRVVGPPEVASDSVWQGGSIIASRPTFPDICVTHAEYDEVGPRIVNVKCF